MSDKKIIQGAGGGKDGGSGRSAVEAQDNLRSTQIAQVVDLICEGPIAGLSDDMRSVFINETPLMNKDGTMNFQNVAIQWRKGDQIQNVFDGLTGVESEVAVGATVKKTLGPVVRSITAPEADMVRVTISTQQLTEQNKQTGDINGSSVTFHIDVQNAGTGWQTRITDTISGKTTSKYERAYLIPFNGPGPWDVRVIRDTDDSTSVAIQNEIKWESYTTIVKANLSYPNSAMVYTRIDAQQFNSIPSRGYGVKGLIVKVPSNYDAINRTYNGTWDGTFRLSWTDNPAWCFYDLLTNERYGLGQYIDSNAIDKWTLYSIGQYCDQKVPNGYGGYEARFRCNLYLQSREEAYNVVQNFASIFRGITYWGAGTLMTLQDRPADPVALYTPANVINGEFSYAGSSIKQRHTVALVAWSDPTDFYRQKIEYVQDEELVKKYGIIETNVTAFGCTSRGQAHRYGKWLLAIERFCSETVTFKAGYDSAGLYPGAVIQTADPNRAGKRMGGRIQSYTAATVTLDTVVELEIGRTYKITIVDQDTIPRTFDVTSGPGQVQTLNVSPAITHPIVPNAVFIMAADNLVPEKWRVIGVKESENGQVEVAALSYNESIYDYVELGSPFVLPPVSVIKAKPATPQNLSLITYAYVVDGQQLGLNGTLSWTANANKYRIRWRRNNGAWQDRTTTETATEIQGLTNEPHTFQVVAISSAGVESDAATLVITPSLDGVNLPDVTGLSLDGPFTIDQAKFKWDKVSGAESYEVQIKALGVVRRFLNIGNSLTYTYSASDMKLDGGPFRTITIEVRARGKFGSRSNWASLTVGNPQIGLLEGIDVQYGIKSIFFQCEKPQDPDYAGIIIWLGTDPHFEPTADKVVYDGPDCFKVIYQDGAGNALEGGKTYYVRAAGYDNFGKDSLIYSNSFLVIPAKNAPDEASITRDMIEAGAIDITKLAEGITPVVLVPALENPPTVFKGSVTVYNEADKKMYRWDGTQYVHKIGQGDLEADSVTAGVIAAGAVSAREIAAGAITADKIYIVSRGAALNNDPGMLDRTAWAADANITFVKIADGTVGQYAARSATGKAVTLLGNEKIPVSVNKIYRLQAYTRRTPTANGLMYMGVMLFDANDAIVKSQYGDWWFVGSIGLWPDASGGWSLNSGALNVGSTAIPTSAKYAKLVALLNTGGTAGYMELQDFRMEEVLPGTLIQDGAISTAKITAGAITGDKILANSITSEKIVSNAITADKIAAQSITANHLAAGAITAGSIAAGSITSDKIDTRNLTIKDASGNVLFGAGVNLSASRVVGLGNFAYLNAIDAQNISTYIASAAITSAYIANLSVTSAHIQDLTVGTNKISIGAVTGNVGGVGNNFIDVLLPVNGGNVAVFGKVKQANPPGGSGSEILSMEIRANDFAISFEQIPSVNDPDNQFIVSLSSFTLHQPPAGQTIKYTVVGGSTFNSAQPVVCQILCIEFKR